MQLFTRYSLIRAVRLSPWRDLKTLFGYITPRPVNLIRSLDCSCDDIRAVAFSHDGQKLVAGGRDGHIRIWNVADGSVLNDWQGHEHRIRILAISPSADRIASAGDDHQIRVWDVATAQQQMAVDHGHGKVLALCFCGEDRLASGGSDNLVRVWNLSTQKTISSFTGHTGSVAAMACDPTGKMLISGGFDTTIRVWQMDREGNAQAAREIQNVRSR